MMIVILSTRHGAALSRTATVDACKARGAVNFSLTKFLFLGCCWVSAVMGVGTHMCRFVTWPASELNLGRFFPLFAALAKLKEGTLEDDDDISCGMMLVSINCPLSQTRMVHPARGSRCTHLQCFDALSYLMVRPFQTLFCFAFGARVAMVSSALRALNYLQFTADSHGPCRFHCC